MPGLEIEEEDDAFGIEHWRKEEKLTENELLNIQKIMESFCLRTEVQV